MLTDKIVVLLGKLGHGKTRILNKICGTHHPSNMGTRSCTRTLQHGTSKQNGIFVVDTPGLYARQDPAAHLAGVKTALEGIPLSGVYAVVRWGRTDDIGEILEPILDFVGNDDVRVIITHADIAYEQEGFDEEETKEELSEEFNIPLRNLAVIGHDTSPDWIENFIQETLHKPRKLELSDAQIAAISFRTAGHRRSNKPINAVVGKIEAAAQACHEITGEGGNKTYETDVIITFLQDKTTKMVENEKELIFRDALENLTQDQQNLVYGKAGIALSLKLKNFIEITNKYLSWDIADMKDPRNHYRKCPHCEAIFVKVEGCDGATTCGAVPEVKKLSSAPRMEINFSADAMRPSTFQVQFWVNGARAAFSDLPNKLKALFRSTTSRNKTNEIHTKQSGAQIESGCGRRILWSTMVPVELSKLKALKTIELNQPKAYEDLSQSIFKKNLKKHEERNKKILLSGLRQAA